MYYELYIDSLFFMDFVMNFYMLYLVNKVRRCSATHLRILLAAAYGAVIYCVLFLVPIRWIGLRIGMGIVLSGLGMAAITFRCRTFQQFVKILSSMAGAAFFLGGIYLFFKQRIFCGKQNAGGVWYAAGVGGIACIAGCFLLERSRSRTPVYCRVRLQFEERKLDVYALIDTGNSLLEPVSKKPVSVLDYDTAKTLFGGTFPEYYRVVPFTSIGKKKGILKCFEIPKIWVECQDCERVLEKIWVACSEEYTCHERYHMILNPRLLKNQEEKKYDI